MQPVNTEEALELVQARLADYIAERNESFAGQIRQLKLHLVKEDMWSSTVAVSQMQGLATAEFRARKNLILQTWQHVLSTLDSVNRALLLPQAAQTAAQVLTAERDHLESVVISQSVGGLPNPPGFLDSVCVLATRRLQAELGFQDTGAGQSRVRGTRVFISYAHEDIDYARKMFHELQNASYDPWLDCESLLPGQRWESAIEQAMRESHYVLALISSRSSVKRGYVQKEIKRALDLLEQIPENDIFLIPARLDQCEPTHGTLRGVHWVDLFPSWEAGVGKIIRALNQMQGTRELKEYLALPESDRSVPYDKDKPLGDKFVDSDMAEFYQRAKRELLDLFAKDAPSIFLPAAASWTSRMEMDLGDEEERVESGMAKVRQEAEGKNLTEAEKQAHAITAFMWITTTAGRAKKQELLQQLRHLLSLARSGGGDMDDTVIAQKVVRILSRERVAAPNPIGRADS